MATQRSAYPLRKSVRGKGNLGVQPICATEPRTLHICRLASRPPTFASEAIRDVLLDLVREAVRSGTWEAQLVARS